MRILLIGLVSLVSFNSYALFQEIYTGYRSSDRLKEITLEQETIQQKLNYGIGQKEWVFDTSSNYTDTNLESLFSFQSEQTITNKLSFGLTRPTFRFGTFSIRHERTEYDLSNWQQSALASFSDDKVFENKNIFSYNLEILNSSDRLTFKEVKLQNKADNLEQLIREDKDHYDFFLAYLKGKLEILTNRLNIEFEKRSVERIRVIKRRQRDGLSRSIDVKSARLAYLTNQEMTLKNAINMRDSVAKLETVVGFKIPKKLYKKVSWDFKEVNKFDFINANREFNEVKKRKALSHLTQIKLEKQKGLSAQSLSLNLSYIRNDFDGDKGESFNNALSTAENDEKRASLTYKIPFGGGASHSVSEILRVQNLKDNLSISRLEDGLKSQLEQYTLNINEYARGVRFIQTKVKLSNQIAKENQKLYLRGKASVEEVLRSEESYIQARLALYGMYALYESELASKAYLNGKIKTFLTRYRD